MEEDKYFDDIDSLFKERDKKKYEEAIRLARESAVNARREERKSNRKKKDLQVLKRKMIGLVLSAVIILGVGVTLGDNIVEEAKEIGSDIVQVVEDTKNYSIDGEYNMFRMSQKIGSIVFEKDENFVESLDSTERTILSQCTFDGFQGTERYTFYNHSLIAQKLEDLCEKTESKEMLSYALCALANDMNENIYNKVAIGERTNIDGVIFFLASSDNANVKEFLGGKVTFDDLLVHLNQVDENGLPSLEVFKDNSNALAPEIQELIVSYNSSRGVSK